MRGLLEARLLRNGKLFERALQEACHCLAVKQHAAKVDVQSAGHDSACMHACTHE